MSATTRPPRLPRPEAPTAQGTFARTPFAHVLLYMRDKRLSGSLVIQAGAQAPAELAGESLLAFEQGALTQVALPGVVEPLGFVLREMGVITDAQLNESLAHLAAGRGLQGQILLAMGTCDAVALERGLRAQLRRKALRLFTVREAGYQYYAGCDLLAGYGDDAHRMGEDVLAIIWRGVRGAGSDATAIDAVLARTGGQALRLKQGAELRAFEFERAEQAVIDLLRVDALTLEQLERAATDARLLRALVYVLMITRQVELVPPGTARPAAPVTAKRPTPPPGFSPFVSARQTPAPGAWGLPPDGGPIPPAPTAPTAPFVPRRPTPPPTVSPHVPAAEPSSSPAHVPARIAPTGMHARRPSVPPGEPSTATASSASPRPLSPEHRALLEKAEQRLKSLQDETYFQMLGVEPDVSDERLRARFLELAAVWHPDRAPDVPALRETYQHIFAMLNEAHETLLDATARKRYLPTLQEGGGTPNAQRKIAQLIDAATDIQKAEVCLRRRDWAEAERLVRRALAVTPDDVNGQCVLATVLLERASVEGALAEGEALLARAVKQAPGNDRVLVLYGTLLKRKGDEVRALYQFRRAAEANPKNVEAAREIRLAEMRKRNGHSVPPPPNKPAGGPASGDKGGSNAGGAGGFFSKLLKK